MKTRKKMGTKIDPRYVKGPRKQLRKKDHATATESRMRYRDSFWIPLRKLLQVHFETKQGQMREMSKATGIADAMLHQYSCPDCEHDTEPSFSVGMVMLLYLMSLEFKNKAFNEHDVIPNIYKLHKLIPMKNDDRLWQRIPSVTGTGYFYIHKSSGTTIILSKEKKAWIVQYRKTPNKPCPILFSDEKKAMRFVESIFPVLTKTKV
jgi:hypothetical protein